jgi:outer membrane receptor protein involved in Fe transport
MSRAVARRPRSVLLAAALLCLGPEALHADPGCGASAVAPGPTAQSWPAPLDRPVSLQARDVSLRSALDRVAAAARVDVAYSADLLPLDRPVCISRRNAPMGDVLRELLRGTSVEAVVAGPGHVVLAPSQRPAAQAPERPTGPVALDRVVVTGTPGGATERTLPLAVDVLGRTRLDALATGTLSQVLDAAVPGMWAWEQSPASVSVRYASIRGASSFAVSYPKVFIDGIEIANPLLLSRFGGEAVERIEVIRGPQGAALYGTDAISGVVNIVTRQDAGGPPVRVRSAVGSASSRFGASPSLSQDHEVALRWGSGVRSAGLTVGGGSVGAFVPGAFDRYLLATGTGRIVGTRTITTATVRLSAEHAGSPSSPLSDSLAAALPRLSSQLPQYQPLAVPADSSQTARQYTLGVTTSWAPDERWTHTFVAGVDGERVSGAGWDPSRLSGVDDAWDGYVDGGADRATLRASSVARVGSASATSATLSLSAEHSALHESLAWPVSGSRGGLLAHEGSWLHSSAAVAQANVGFRDALFVTAGVRGERNEAFTGRSLYAALPLLGAAAVAERGSVRVKLRAAYGTGTRPASTAARETSGMGARGRIASSSLAPERQSGVEAGADLFLGDVATLRVTRFDQLASGLIQRVGMETSELERGDSTMRHGGRGLSWTLQNVGQISNRGWEMQASTELGPLSLTGAFSTVDSRVRRVAQGYGGDLAPGDRTLEVPAWTAGLTAAWSHPGWSASAAGYRAGDWIGYDYVTMARASADEHRPDSDFVGTGLRRYWRTYHGVTHLRATLSRDLSRGLSLVLSGDNLLGRQQDEPDNLTVLPGRTLTVGVRAQF